MVQELRGELFALCLVPGDLMALGEEFANQTGRGWVVVGWGCGVATRWVEGWCWRAISGGGQSHCSGGLELRDGGEDGQAGFGNFVEQASAELDGGEKSLGYGALDASISQSLDDLIESGEGGRLVDKRRKMERF